jgi:hypothetical protein
MFGSTSCSPSLSSSSSSLSFAAMTAGLVEVLPELEAKVCSLVPLPLGPGQAG